MKIAAIDRNITVLFLFFPGRLRVQRDGREARDADQDADAAHGPEGRAIQGTAGPAAGDGRPSLAGAGKDTVIN